MKTSISTIASAIAVTTGLTLASVSIAAGNDYGSASVADAATRVITINANTRWVNVEHDETVNIVNAANGQSFVWNFDTAAMVLDLAAVAPAEVLGGRHISAYVSHNDVSDGD
jgi:Heavy-metal resistance protein CzcE